MKACTCGGATLGTGTLLEVTQLESKLAEKDLWILVNTKLNMSQQWALAAKKARYIYLHFAKHHQQVKGGDSSRLFSTGEAVPGVPHPVLGSLLQDRHGLT